MLNIITAVSENGVIGKDNKLPWAESYPDDLRRFRKLTLGCTVIMGRKTWESMRCKPLKKRSNIVITSETDKEKFAGAIVCRTVEEAIEVHNKYKILHEKNHAWFIGGASIYEEALKHAQLIDFTYIPETIDGENLVIFPDFDKNQWKEWESFKNNNDKRLQHQMYTRKIYT